MDPGLVQGASVSQEAPRGMRLAGGAQASLLALPAHLQSGRASLVGSRPAYCHAWVLQCHL